MGGTLGRCEREVLMEDNNYKQTCLPITWKNMDEHLDSMKIKISEKLFNQIYNKQQDRISILKASFGL